MAGSVRDERGRGHTGGRAWRRLGGKPERPASGQRHGGTSGDSPAPCSVPAEADSAAGAGRHARAPAERAPVHLSRCPRAVVAVAQTLVKGRLATAPACARHPLLPSQPTPPQQVKRTTHPAHRVRHWEGGRQGEGRQKQALPILIANRRRVKLVRMRLSPRLARYVMPATGQPATRARSPRWIAGTPRPSLAPPAGTPGRWRPSGEDATPRAGQQARRQAACCTGRAVSSVGEPGRPGATRGEGAGRGEDQASGRVGA